MDDWGFRDESKFKMQDLYPKYRWEIFNFETQMDIESIADMNFEEYVKQMELLKEMPGRKRKN